MRLNSVEMSKLIKERIAQFEIFNQSYNEGIIISVSDGIIKIHGLANVMLGEMIALSNNEYAMALNIERDTIGAVVMGPYVHITEGMKVRCTGKILEVPVGLNLLGRVVNALGIPIDGNGSIKNDGYFPVERDAPGVIDRKSIDEPIQTGYKIIDSLIPIGRGQRELIIGDRQTGKTALAIDTIINQNKSGVKCIYVAIGQKLSTTIDVVNKLKQNNALLNTIIVVASAAEAASLQYLSPYSGCAMAEYFRNQGQDVLIVYDDLSKHAVAYRQISLLLRRPPGREAFPGDIFYLHSRLLERSSRVSLKYIEHINKNKNINKKTGSITALPIIETQAGDVSAFVPTNVISITDGQIFLESSLFNSGIRPAVNPSISVSRVGSAAQSLIIKKLSSGIRAALAQYQELAAFSQFSSDLDEITRKQLDHGQKIIELFKQKQYSPLSIAEQSLMLVIIENNFLDNIALDQIIRFETEILAYAKHYYSELMENINTTGNWDIYTEQTFKKLISEFKKNQF